MSNKKNEQNSLISKNLNNEDNPHYKSLINTEMNKIHQDFIFFKNETLIDIRKVEERFNFKLTEQSVISSEQYDSFDKKLTELTERITKVESLILDNNELTEKIKNFLRFKTKAEENFNRINSKISTVQKENGTFINNLYEKVGFPS